MHNGTIVVRGNLILTGPYTPLFSSFVDRLIRSSPMLEQSMHLSQPQPHPRAAHWYLFSLDANGWQSIFLVTQHPSLPSVAKS
tara:strand:- start:25 stop:273 length:249 start_codon:yes stop_codon:yes gene_type:complete